MVSGWRAKRARGLGCERMVMRTCLAVARAIRSPRPGRPGRTAWVGRASAMAVALQTRRGEGAAQREGLRSVGGPATISRKRGARSVAALQDVCLGAVRTTSSIGRRETTGRGLDLGGEGGGGGSTSRSLWMRRSGSGSLLRSWTKSGAWRALRATVVAASAARNVRLGRSSAAVTREVSRTA